MQLAIMQPYVFPYIGYFQLIAAVDKFVVYDDVHFIKGGWINRNRILVGGKASLFSVPLHKPSPNRLICDIELNRLQYPQFVRKFLKTLQQSYGHAPFFGATYALAEAILSTEVSTIAELCLCGLEQVSRHLDITTEFVRSSGAYANRYLSSQDRVIDICTQEGATRYVNAPGGRALYSVEDFRREGIELLFVEPLPITYRQFDNEFVPNLSILDVLMFNGFEGGRDLLEQRRIVP